MEDDHPHLGAAKVDELIRAGDITVNIVRYEELEDIKSKNLRVIDVASSFNNKTDQDSQLGELSEFGTTLIRGIQTVNTLQEDQNGMMPLQFTSLVVQNHTLVISNITAILPKPGKYALIFGVNGVLTDIYTDEAIIDVTDNEDFIGRTFNWGETTFLTIFYFLTLVFASKMVKGYWMLLAILMTAVFLYFMSYKTHISISHKVAIYFFGSLISSYFIWVLFVYFVDTWIKKKHPSYFYHKKKQYLMEYVYQLINNHPSNFWVNKSKGMGMKLNGLYNTSPKIDLNAKSFYNESANITEDEETQRKINQDMTSSMELYRTQSEHSLLSDYLPEPKQEVKKLSMQELRNLPVDVTPYVELNTFRKFIRILTPFSLMYRKIWVKDCFIYPQMMLTCIIICLFSMSFLGYQTFNMIFDFTDSLSDGYDKVYQSSFTFLRNGLDR